MGGNRHPKVASFGLQGWRQATHVGPDIRSSGWWADRTEQACESQAEGEAPHPFLLPGRLPSLYARTPVLGVQWAPPPRLAESNILTAGLTDPLGHPFTQVPSSM